MHHRGQEYQWGHRQGKPWSEWSFGAKIAAIGGGLVAGIGLLSLIVGLTVWLWNSLMPAIFKLPTIDFWQGLGLLVLSQILIKGGTPVHRWGRGPWKRHQVWKHLREEDAPLSAPRDPQ